MKIRKFLLCAAAFGAMASVSVLNAQDQKKGRGGMPTPEQRIERLEQAVGSLSADQKGKIKAIYAKSAEQMQAIPQDERREKMGPMMQAAQKEIRAVLTAEQQKKFDEMAQGRGGREGGSRDGGGRGKKKEG
jgi:Spy/CpxP family protein refolding chaperone